MPTTKRPERTPDIAEDPTSLMNEMMIEQAHMLREMFAELVKDAVAHRPYRESMATYMRLALRTQANCRASLQAVELADRARRRDSKN